MYILWDCFENYKEVNKKLQMADPDPICPTDVLNLAWKSGPSKKKKKNLDNDEQWECH